MTKLEDMSEPERQSWITLLADGAVFLYIWHSATQGHGFKPQNFSPSEIGSIFVNVVIVTIVLHTVIALVFEMRKRKDPFTKDERDTRITARGSHVGYGALQIGVGLLIVIVLIQYWLGDRYHGPVSVIKPVEILFALCVISYVADLLKQAVQIYHYRQS